METHSTRLNRRGQAQAGGAPGKNEDISAVGEHPEHGCAPNTPGWRPFVWDGLGLDIPADWSPARLGRGYVLLEDASGPRLSLRWQRLPKGQAPARALAVLARRKVFHAGEAEGPVRAMLEAAAGGGRGLAASHGPAGDDRVLAAGHGPAGERALLILFPGERLAVLAAPHGPEGGSRAGDRALQLARIAASLGPCDPGIFCLYDVSARAPRGFSLRTFSVDLGRYRFQYARGGDSLEFFRFAPAEVVLRGDTLAGWASRTFSARADRPRPFAAGRLAGMEAAFHPPGGEGEHPPGLLRRLCARLCSPCRWERIAVWRPDEAKILAMACRHGGSVNREEFLEVCQGYVVQAP